jgi:Cu(I)/Ag(I) efflux system membrane fusion protein
MLGKSAVVYVEIPNDEGPLYEGREVELGPRAGEFYVVKEGIEEGELVVTNGAFKIDSELQIHAKSSMMSPEGGITSGGHQHGATAAAATPQTHDGSMPPSSVENSKVRKALTPVYTAYFDVQMALAKDNLADARAASKKLTGVTTKVDMTLFSQKGRAHWMEFSKKLIKHSGALSTSKDIDSARDSFFHLSNAILATHQAFGHSGDVTYYLTHCPMARSGDGADWLQKENIVWNSFYGASMLRCGTIKEITLQKSKENN